jgi:hypothetical protein
MECSKWTDGVNTKRQNCTSCVNRQSANKSHLICGASPRPVWNISSSRCLQQDESSTAAVSSTKADEINISEKVSRGPLDVSDQIRNEKIILAKDLVIKRRVRRTVFQKCGDDESRRDGSSSTASKLTSLSRGLARRRRRRGLAESVVLMATAALASLLLVLAAAGGPSSAMAMAVDAPPAATCRDLDLHFPCSCSSNGPLIYIK